MIEVTLKSGEIRRPELDYTLELSFIRTAGWCLWWRDPDAERLGEHPVLIGSQADDGFRVSIGGVVVDG